jgi:hypothetical protein
MVRFAANLCEQGRVLPIGDDSSERGKPAMINLFCTLEPTKIDWLPQFVAHYRSLGVDRFLLSLQQEPTVAAQARLAQTSRFESALRGLGITQSFELTESYDSASVYRHQERISNQFVTKDDWIVWCDSDEFQVYPLPIAEVVQSCLAQGIDAITGILIDRIAADGSLPDFDPSRPVWEVFSRPCNVTGSIARGPMEKVAFARSDIRLRPGNHAPEDPKTKCAAQAIPIHHFKWHAGVIAQLRFRLDPAWKQKCFWWIESQYLLDYLARNDMRFKLDDVPVIALPAGGVFDAGAAKSLTKPAAGMADTIVLQAWHEPPIPEWIERCLASVRHWSSTQQFAYKFVPRGLLARSPEWFRHRCGSRQGPVADHARLLLMQDLFDQGYGKVIWVDSAVLVFDAALLRIDIAHGMLATYQVTPARSHVDGAGAAVSGSILAAENNHPVFNFYRHAAEESVRNFRGGEMAPDIAGSALMARIASIVPIECMTTVGQLAPEILADIARGGDRLANEYIVRHGFPIAAANLGLSRYEGIEQSRQAELDAILLAATERLIATHGDCINRWLPRQDRSSAS